MENILVSGSLNRMVGINYGPILSMHNAFACMNGLPWFVASERTQPSKLRINRKVLVWNIEHHFSRLQRFFNYQHHK
ncbi:hypothetical protein PT974_10828 [Cladobotryum mycophilum]|uniref:Uncharacterized protein n=1 Tax=Cladobotryum mycophilum TaxID=491253 RepID=A0ABR0SB02_9HYPO